MNKKLLVSAIILPICAANSPNSFSSFFPNTQKHILIENIDNCNQHKEVYSNINLYDDRNLLLDYINDNGEEFSELEQYKIITKFVSKLVNESKDIESDFLKVFNDNYDYILL